MDLGKFFQNLATLGKEWGSYFIMFLGVIMLIWAAVLIFKAFAQHGRGQSNWLMIFLMLIVGGWMMVQGFTGIARFADMGAATLERLAQ